MGGLIADAIRALAGLPPLLIYVVIGTGAAVENVVPVIPADTFVLFGAFISANGRVSATLVFLVTWVLNVGMALVVYGLAYHYGQRFFKTPAGHWLLHPRQLEQIGRFYGRWGTPAIFVSRFLPGLRAMVPVFAGVTHVSFPRVALPVATASGLWYGFVVYVGAVMGRNWQVVLDLLEGANRVLLLIAAPLLLGVGVWWWKSRRHHRQS